MVFQRLLHLQGHIFFCFLLYSIFGSGAPAFLQPHRQRFIILAEHNLLFGDASVVVASVEGVEGQLVLAPEVVGPVVVGAVEGQPVVVPAVVEPAVVDPVGGYPVVVSPAVVGESIRIFETWWNKRCDMELKIYIVMKCFKLVNKTYHIFHMMLYISP